MCYKEEKKKKEKMAMMKFGTIKLSHFLSTLSAIRIIFSLASWQSDILFNINLSLIFASNILTTIRSHSSRSNFKRIFDVKNSSSILIFMSCYPQIQRQKDATRSYTQTYARTHTHTQENTFVCFVNLRIHHQRKPNMHTTDNGLFYSCFSYVANSAREKTRNRR